jgi:hypothetical protein
MKIFKFHNLRRKASSSSSQPVKKSFNVKDFWNVGNWNANLLQKKTWCSCNRRERNSFLYNCAFWIRHVDMSTGCLRCSSSQKSGLFPFPSYFRLGLVVFYESENSPFFLVVYRDSWCIGDGLISVGFHRKSEPILSCFHVVTKLGHGKTTILPKLGHDMKTRHIVPFFLVVYRDSWCIGDGLRTGLTRSSGCFLHGFGF